MSLKISTMSDQPRFHPPSYFHGLTTVPNYYITWYGKYLLCDFNLLTSGKAIRGKTYCIPQPAVLHHSKSELSNWMYCSPMANVILVLWLGTTNCRTHFLILLFGRKFGFSTMRDSLDIHGDAGNMFFFCFYKNQVKLPHTTLT